MSGNYSLTQEVVDKRRFRAAELRMKGLSVTSVVKLLNQEAVTQMWGVVSRRTATRDIAQYFEQNKLKGIEANEELARLRDAYVAQYEGLIEKMSIKLATKGDWKPFEEFSAMDILRRTLGDFAEIMNWNEGRKNPNTLIQQNNVFGSYENASYLVEKPKELKALGEIFKMGMEGKSTSDISVEVLGEKGKNIKESENDNNI